MKRLSVTVKIIASPKLSFEAWNTKVAAALKDLFSALKKKGFVRTHSSKQSALFEVEYTRKDERVIIDGWHGTGKYNGPKAIFGVAHYVGGLTAPASTEFEISSSDIDSDTRAGTLSKDYAPDLKIMETNLAKVKKFISSL